MKDEIIELTNNLIKEVNNTFLEFLIAKRMFETGHFNSDKKVRSPFITPSIRLEPIPLSKFEKFRNYYPTFLYEVFHGKFVQLINEFLDDIFATLIEAHFSGNRKFIELKKKYIKLNFDSEEDFKKQIKIQMIKDFSFMEYSKKQKLINNVFNPTDPKTGDTLLNLKKNVLIRNSIQHNNSIIDAYFLKKLGTSTVDILDSNGNPFSIREGDRISLSLPEINHFKSSILLISNIWRESYELFDGSSS